MLTKTSGYPHSCQIKMDSGAQLVIFRCEAIIYTAPLVQKMVLTWETPKFEIIKSFCSFCVEK